MFLIAELESMQAALLKVCKEPMDQPPDVQVKLSAREVRELSYDLQDIINKFVVRIDTHAPMNPHSFKGFVDRCINLVTRSKTRHHIGIQVKDVKSRLKEVSERRDSTRLILLPSSPLAQAASTPFASQLMKQLLKIVSIVGFGGLGKTTLAKVVYEKLKGKFDCAAFVTVSFDPVMEKIFKNMLHQLDRNKYININEATWSVEQLINETREFLRYKRYFIVIDDVWNGSVWETIKYALVENECGSRIITTTRNIDVAKQAGGIYQLEPLSLDYSRKLFYLRVFGMEDQHPPNELVEVSENILKKCGGVPLAIITIASMLASKKEKGSAPVHWSKVYQFMGSGLENSPDLTNMRRILSISYYDLPAQLKTCLLFLSLYPEDYRIDTEKLIWHWIGEGFVHKEHGKSLYKAGEDYVAELTHRSLIETTYVHSDSNRRSSVRVHDMVLDLITYLSQEDNFLIALGGHLPMSLPKKVHRLSLQTSTEENIQKISTISMSHVRSLSVFAQAFNLVPTISTFSILRALELSSCKEVDNNFCKDICNLLHLRYLRLSRTSITEIPEEIRNLQFLQVLDISSNNIKRLPSSFVQLQQLVYLHVPYGIELPDGFGNLKSLQELAKDILITSPSMLHDLGRLTESRTIGIHFDKFDDSYLEPLLQCLSNLVYLESLKLDGLCGSMDLGCENPTPGFQQLCALEYISLSCIPTMPRWMSSLPSLSYVVTSLLTLGEEDLQVLGSIPVLDRLVLAVKKPIRHKKLVIGNGYPFHRLTHFTIFSEAMEVIFAPGAMQKLQTLMVDFYVQKTMDQIGEFDFGLENLPLLEDVTAWMHCKDAKPEGVQAAEAAIRGALEMNPNKPRLELRKWQPMS